MEPTRIQPERIHTPIQLLAVWFAALVLLVGALLGTAAAVDDPEWLRVLLVFAAILIVPFFTILIYRMQTKYRPELLQGQQYLQYLQIRFGNFVPENVQRSDEPSLSSSTAEVGDEAAPMEALRIQEYQDNQGIFLVHDWRPSKLPGQVADIAIYLVQHMQGPLGQGRVTSVEYHLGPKFFEKPIVKTNASENFRLDVSAYYPMLCIAKVNLPDGWDPIVLRRYIDFPAALPQ